MSPCAVTNFHKMDESLEKKIKDAIADPKNMGELADADRVGTVGNSDCGEMLKLSILHNNMNKDAARRRGIHRSAKGPGSAPTRSLSVFLFSAGLGPPRSSA